MFIVAGVTGNTGSAVAQALRAAGKHVTALVRSEKAKEEVESRGMTALLVPLEDSEKLAAALAGAEGAYLLLPPHFGPRVLESQRQVAESIATALRRAQLPRVVLLSSIAAERESGTGPIMSVRYLEQITADLDGVTYLRASLFQQNWLAVLGAAQEEKVLPSFLPAEGLFSMVAAQDIGQKAAEILLQDTEPARIVQLAGPQDYSVKDVAREFSQALGHDVTALDLPVTQVVPTFVELGVPEELARLYEEMYGGMHQGIIAWESKHPITRGKLTPRDVVASQLSQAAK